MKGSGDSGEGYSQSSSKQSTGSFVMSARPVLAQVLGYEAFGPSEAKAFLSVAGVGWEDDPAVAAKIVELWLSGKGWRQHHTDAWPAELLHQAHAAVHHTGTPDARSFSSSSLFRLLKTSHDPGAEEPRGSRARMQVDPVSSR